MEIELTNWRDTMKMHTLTRSASACAAAAFAAVAVVSGAMERAHAAEIRVLSAAAMQSIFKVIAGEFEHQSGVKLVMSYGTMGAITDRVLAGETADLIIGSTQSVERLAKEGKIDPSTRVTVARVGVGVVVPTGTPKLPIGSAEELRRALLDAQTVVYASPAGGGAAGIHIARVIEQLGISEQLKPKTKFGAGGDVTEVTLAQGVGTLGMTQVSEIVNKVGAEFVGPFPDELQNYTGVTLGILTGVARSRATTALIEFLKSPVAVSAIEAQGMQVE
jgi:molybdate transport system substrate-binding protein